MKKLLGILISGLLCKKYYSYKPFLEKVEKEFGKLALENIISMNKITLKRKILENDKIND